MTSAGDDRERAGIASATAAGGFARAARLGPWLAFAFSFAVDAASLRCSGGVVRTGDSTETVERRCGPPHDRQGYQREFTRRDASGADQLRVTDVETWTYDRGYGKFYQYLKFEGGRLQRIDIGPRHK